MTTTATKCLTCWWKQSPEASSGMRWYAIGDVAAVNNTLIFYHTNISANYKCRFTPRSLSAKITETEVMLKQIFNCCTDDWRTWLDGQRQSILASKSTQTRLYRGERQKRKITLKGITMINIIITTIRDIYSSATKMPTVIFWMDTPTSTMLVRTVTDWDYKRIHNIIQTWQWLNRKLDLSVDMTVRHDRCPHNWVFATEVGLHKSTIGPALFLFTIRPNN